MPAKYTATVPEDSYAFGEKMPRLVAYPQAVRIVKTMNS